MYIVKANKVLNKIGLFISLNCSPASYESNVLRDIAKCFLFKEQRPFIQHLLCDDAANRSIRLLLISRSLFTVSASY